MPDVGGGSPLKPLRFRYIRSAMYGMNGATSPDSVISTVCNVANAACASALVPALFQKRRRERRTYHFETSSTNASTACVASDAS